jgi:hypothetical protein
MCLRFSTKVKIINNQNNAVMLLEDKIEMLIGVEDLTTMLQRKTNN